MLSGSGHAKAARKMLMKLTTESSTDFAYKVLRKDIYFLHQVDCCN